jgi:zona occludens toxin (predicted ATPase)
MKTELTTREVDFTLISDFNPIKPTTFSQVPDDETTELKFAIIFSNDVFKVTVTPNVGDVTLSQNVFTSEGFLTVTTPNYNIGQLVEITLLSEFNNGNTETDYIIIEQI